MQRINFLSDGSSLRNSEPHIGLQTGLRVASKNTYGGADTIYGFASKADSLAKED